MTLYYLHHMPTFQLLGIILGVSESTANNIFHYWIDIFRELLPASLLEQAKKKQSEYLWIKEVLTEL
ncbi:MAG: transposase family protein [Trichodesmium sp. MO_231.B1]|nr:transposase family protein [Trichodesmium sp. MO_231.B1]